ncbi:MAG TPA: acyltransferase [Gemmatimonadales bacterium]|jgi:peptidoglycan/LPS O-acetylase OafA/YrhL
MATTMDWWHSKRAWPAPPYGHLPALDGLRGVLVWFVALRHFNDLWNPSTPKEHIYSFFVHLSITALDVFFAMSGFLITGILLESKGKQFYFRNFYIRRTLRIFPVYYAFLFVWFILLPLVVRDPHAPFRQPALVQVWYWTYTTNFMIALRAAPFAPGTYHFWSLAYEEQFYFLWPAVVFLCSRKALIRFTIGAFFFALLFRTASMLLGWPYEAGFLLLPGHIDPLALGCLLALVAHDPSWRERISKWAAPAWMASFAVIAGIIVSTEHFLPEQPVVRTIGMTASAICAAATIVIVASLTVGSWPHRFLASKPMVQLGTYSYAWYILHYPVRQLTELLGLHEIQFTKWLHIRLLGQLVYTAFLTALAVVAAALSWHLLEKRMLKLKRLFPYGQALKPVPPAP